MSSNGFFFPCHLEVSTCFNRFMSLFHSKTSSENTFPISYYSKSTSLSFLEKKRKRRMLQLLFSVIFSQMALILLLMFKTPLRKLVIISLDRAKRGRGPLVVKSVGATVFVIMMYTVYSVQEIHSRPLESFNPTDQVLLAYQILQASLMGFILFLALMIDRQHHYIREIRSLRKNAEASKKQNRGSDDAKNGRVEELNTLKEEASTCRKKISALESKLNDKIQELKAAEANADSLKKQSEGLLLEYDRLLEENQNLRSQLQSIDQNHSDGKKNS